MMSEGIETNWSPGHLHPIVVLFGSDRSRFIEWKWIQVLRVPIYS